MVFITDERKFLFVYSFCFFLFLLGLIGFNVLLLFSTSNILLAFIFDLFKPFLLPLNLTLVSMVWILAIPFTIVWRKYIISKSPIIKKHYTTPELEEKILKVLASKRRKFVSPMYLRRKVKFGGTLKEFKSILQRLREENKVKFDKDDYPYYNVRLS